MKTSNPYLLAEIASIEDLFRRDANELEIVKHIDTLTEHSRLLKLENKQLAKDKAELIRLVESAYIEGCHEGYGDGLSDGQNWSSSKSNLEPDESWEFSESKTILEKHK